MKFLGWMHRKLTHNATDPNKNSTIRNLSSCFSEKNYYKEPTKTLAGFNIKCQKTSSRSEAIDVDVNFHEESFDPFGFLAIGTFGMELSITDPPTPTLATPLEKLPNPSEITENDLKFISHDELEKYLEANEKEIPNDTSGGNIQASTITLSHKPIEGEDHEGHVSDMACPLQNYLFATLIEQTEKDEVKRENTSFEDGFRMNNVAHYDPIAREGEERKPRKWNVAHFMKKVAKNLNSSPSCSKASSKDTAATAKSISIKKKLSKAVKMFPTKKIYPQDMTEKQFVKLQKGKTDMENKTVGHDGSEKGTERLSSNHTYTDVSTMNEGRWIKTDSDYLVLEL